MFARFRQTARHLQVSLTEGRRAGAKVRQEHVAGLGSVPAEPTAADRITAQALPQADDDLPLPRRLSVGET